MSEIKLERVYVKSDEPEFIEAEATAHRMWDAMLPEGEQLSRIASVTSLSLLLAQFADTYIKPENHEHFLQEVASNALSIVQQSKAGGSVGGVQ